MTDERKLPSSQDFWHEVPLEASIIHALNDDPFKATRLHLLVTDATKAFLVELRLAPLNGVTVIVSRSMAARENHGPWVTSTLPTSWQFRDLADMLVGGKERRIVVLPPITTKVERRWQGSLPVGIAVGLVLGALSFLIPYLGGWLSLPVAAIAFLIVWRSGFRRGDVRVLAPGHVELEPGNIRDYAVARLHGDRPEARLLEDRRDSIRHRVDSIKDAYGRLTADIAYRIENSALFDSAEPATAEFQAALIAWDTSETTDIAELEALASEVEVTFAIAQDNAEAQGLSHLPETAQASANRAASAVRLAHNAATEGERVASLTQAARILESLALYYLPKVNPETLAIEAPR